MKLFEKIADLFGGNVIDSITSAVDKFVTTDEEKAQLKIEIQKIANTHQGELAKLQMAEMDSARNREIQLKNSIGVWMQNIAAGFVIIAFVCILFMIVKFPMEIANKELAYTLLGILGALVTTLFNYWFGSSQGSSDKGKSIDDLISRLKKDSL